MHEWIGNEGYGTEISPNPLYTFGSKEKPSNGTVRRTWPGAEGLYCLAAAAVLEQT